jgi:hypothetical protein
MGMKDICVFNVGCLKRPGKGESINVQISRINNMKGPNKQEPRRMYRTLEMSVIQLCRLWFAGLTPCSIVGTVVRTSNLFFAEHTRYCYTCYASCCYSGSLSICLLMFR